MKSTRTLFTLTIIVVMITSCLARSIDSKIKYNWAKSGLNIRMSEGVDAEIIGAIPFAAEVMVLEVTSKEYSIEVSEIFSKEYRRLSSSYYLSGHWTKIRYGTIEGYVFDGYLSKLPPMKFIQEKDGNSYIEEYETYLRRVFTPVDSNVVKDVNSDLAHKEIRFENGVVYERNGNVGWYEEIIILPRTSIETGFLIFQLGYDTAQVRTLSEGDKYRITKQGSNELVFWTGEPDGGFEIYQFGGTLIIRRSNSC